METGENVSVFPLSASGEPSVTQSGKEAYARSRPLGRGCFALRVRLSKPARIEFHGTRVKLGAGYYILFSRSNDLGREIPLRMVPPQSRSFWDRIVGAGEEVRAYIFPRDAARPGTVCEWVSRTVRAMNGERLGKAGGRKVCVCGGHLIYFPKWPGGDVPPPPLDAPTAVRPARRK